VDNSVSDALNTFTSNSFGGHFRPEGLVPNWTGEAKHRAEVTATRERLSENKNQESP
jgi:hypothetical protein